MITPLVEVIVSTRRSFENAPPSGKVCGSSLFTLRRDLGRAHVRLGTVDGDPGVRPSLHAFVGSKAPWFEITDSLPRHDASPVGQAGVQR